MLLFTVFACAQARDLLVDIVAMNIGRGVWGYGLKPIASAETRDLKRLGARLCLGKHLYKGDAEGPREPEDIHSQTLPGRVTSSCVQQIAVARV